MIAVLMKIWWLTICSQRTCATGEPIWLENRCGQRIMIVIYGRLFVAPVDVLVADAYYQ